MDKNNLQRITVKKLYIDEKYKYARTMLILRGSLTNGS